MELGFMTEYYWPHLLPEFSSNNWLWESTILCFFPSLKKKKKKVISFLLSFFLLLLFLLSGRIRSKQCVLYPITTHEKFLGATKAPFFYLVWLKHHIYNYDWDGWWPLVFLNMNLWSIEYKSLTFDFLFCSLNLMY